jgi:hypothetical protein
MTSTTHAPVHTTERPSVLSAAAATFLGSLGFIALGIFGDGSASDEHGWGEFFIIVGFAAVAVAAVFGLAVARLQSSPKAGPVGLALALFGLVTVLVFWAGITPALAVGGMLLGAAARRNGLRTGFGTAAVAVGALALLGYVAIYVTDWMSTNNIAGM